MKQDNNQNQTKPVPIHQKTKGAVEKIMAEVSAEAIEEKTRTQAKKLGLSFVELKGYPISAEVVSIIPKELAQKHRMVSYLRAGNKVRVAFEDAEDKEALASLEELGKATGLEFIHSVAAPESIDYVLKLYETVEFKKPGEISISAEGRAGGVEISTLKELAEKVKTVSTTRIIDTVFAGAVNLNASDIHIEPKEAEVKIRYRIDGVLQEVVALPKGVFSQIISRIKFLAKMRMDTHRIAQDGRFGLEGMEEKIDLRVSLIPTIYGESVVARILRQEERFLTLDDLGFRPSAKKIVDEAISRPHGMILNTGPTGSGKTTTLYAILDKLNSPGVKIITLEDPVEYRLSGITQTQIDPDAGFTFASGLRSILRQDPDIVMVGEIRDLETAEIAIQAALTGHIVISTLHTNDAAGAIPRLIEMGIKPFLIVGSFNAILAQRLVRKICPECKEEFEPLPEILEAVKKVWEKIPEAEKIQIKEFPQKFWRGKGCAKCNNTGYAGRIAIVEALTFNPTIEKLTLGLAPGSEIRSAAIQGGMVTMEQDGVLKVVLGLTTMEEVWRVTRE